MRDLMENPVNTIFLGTGWESLATLKALNEDRRFNVVAVITTPDKPVGRKQVLTPSDVKAYALENNISVVHTEKSLEKYMKVTKQYQPELVVCKAFGEIIPKEFLDFPKYKCINVHFSILPKYRGAVPIQKAILDGESRTGITVMLMSEGMDEGDILEVHEEDILPEDTNISLRERLVEKSATILGDILERWVNGDIIPEKQNDEQATYCWQKDISKENAEIKWNIHTPEQISRMVRAFQPWPVCWTRVTSNGPQSISGKTFKIYSVELIEISCEKNPGELFSKDGMLLLTTMDPLVSIRVKELQIEGKNRMSEKDFLNGIGKELLKV